MEFIEAPLFTQLLADFLTDDEYRGLQEQLAREPEAGDVMPETGGFRKLRWADTRRGKGKRGGLRVIYHHDLRQEHDEGFDGRRETNSEGGDSERNAGAHGS